VGVRVWAGTLALPSGRLCTIQNDMVQCFGQDGQFGEGVLSLYEYQGSLWAGASTGLWRWRPESKLYPIPNPTGELTSLVEGGTNRFPPRSGARYRSGNPA
jgi:ligand-binding sensor domain-containing protein